MKSFSSGSRPMYLLLTISLLPIAYIVDRFISPFSKPNIQLVTVMAHHSSADLSYFCLLSDTAQDGQQAILPWIFWLPNFCSPCFEPFSCAVAAALPSSFKSPLPRGRWKTPGQHGCACSRTPALLPLFLPPPSHCWLEALQGKTTAHPLIHQPHPAPHQLFLSTTRVQPTVLVWQQQIKTNHHYQ